MRFALVFNYDTRRQAQQHIQMLNWIYTSQLGGRCGRALWPVTDFTRPRNNWHTPVRISASEIVIITNMKIISYVRASRKLSRFTVCALLYGAHNVYTVMSREARWLVYIEQERLWKQLVVANYGTIMASPCRDRQKPGKASEQPVSLPRFEPATSRNQSRGL